MTITARADDPSITEMKLALQLQQQSSAIVQLAATIRSHLPAAGGMADMASQMVGNTMYSHAAFPASAQMSGSYAYLPEDELILQGYGDITMAYRRVQMATRENLTIDDVNFDIKNKFPREYGTLTTKGMRELLWPYLGFYDAHASTSWMINPPANTPAGLKGLEAYAHPERVERSVFDQAVTVLRLQPGLYRTTSGGNSAEYVLYLKLSDRVLFVQNNGGTPTFYLYIGLERRWVKTQRLDYANHRHILTQFFQQVWSKDAWPEALPMEEVGFRLFAAIDQLAAEGNGYADIGLEDWVRLHTSKRTHYEYRITKEVSWNVLYHKAGPDERLNEETQLVEGTELLSIHHANCYVMFCRQVDGTITQTFKSVPRDERPSGWSHPEPTKEVKEWEDLPAWDKITWPEILLNAVKDNASRSRDFVEALAKQRREDAEQAERYRRQREEEEARRAQIAASQSEQSE